MRLILASGSPRRRELLTQAGYAFEVEAADVDETLSAGEQPTDYVRRLAEEKAQAVYALSCGATKSPGAPSLSVPSIRMGSTNLPLVVPGAPSLSVPSIRVGSTNLPLVVLGADTTVVCNDEIFAKPADAEDAKRMLRKLSGRTHEVLTGVAVVTRAGVVSDVETTLVTFGPIAEEELDFYCATAEPMDKAGAYGIQGFAARWIPRIEGCYFNVMGLPIARVVRLIENATAMVESD